MNSAVTTMIQAQGRSAAARDTARTDRDMLARHCIALFECAAVVRIAQTSAGSVDGRLEYGFLKCLETHVPVEPTGGI